MYTSRFFEDLRSAGRAHNQPFLPQGGKVLAHNFVGNNSVRWVLLSLALLLAFLASPASANAAGAINLGFLRAPGTFSLSGRGLSTLQSVSCSSSSMTGAGTDACEATLSSSALFKVTVKLKSNDSAVTVPSSVTIPAGSSSATFSATATAVSTSQTATLTGTSQGTSKSFALGLVAYTPVLTVSSASIAFGDVTVGSTATQSLTLTSTGTAPVTVNSVASSGAGFSVSGTTVPLTLNPKQTATVNAQFDPSAAGSASGTLTISSNSSTNPTAAVALSGTGEGSTSYQVNLTWQAPSSSPDAVAGYHIYRSPSGSSSYALMGSVSSSDLAYTDTSTVESGQTYNYIVESVDDSGNESSPSNTASVAIP